MSQYSILIIEDDPAVAESLRLGLARDGFAAATVPSGAEGTEFARKHSPHLILLDIRLPDGSGFDTCRQMRQMGLRQPIIMLTAQQDELDKVLGLEMGADDYVTKPFSLRELVSRIRAQLRRFVSDAAHELRTPLTALRTNLDLAQEETDAADRLAFISRARSMVNRLDELSTNLLDLSRLEAAGQTAETPVIDLAELLRSRGEVYASQAEQAGLAFEFEVPPGPVPVRGDGSQITRAMDNMVDNTCKFTPSGGTVHLTLSEDEGHAVFSAADTGIGIPADDLSQLFNRFHRGRNTNAYVGSGLGLAIVKAIAAAQGGGVDVESAGEGQGSRFSFHLPIAPQGR